MSPKTDLTEVQGDNREWTAYNGVLGQFAEITYFLTTMSLREASEQLYLMPQRDLSFGERIQRELNMARVEKEIVPYLRAGGYCFFNAIAVVPVPDRDDTQAFWRAEPVHGTNGVVDKWARLHLLSGVNRVVVDGQHRQKSLELYWRGIQEGQPGAQVDVPVVFIFFGDMGKEAGSPGDRDAVLVGTRRVFRDQNLNARKMDHYTALLVDDAYLPGVMSRRLLETDPELERAVKWSAGSNLTDEDPFITSLGVVTDAIKAYVGDREVLTKDYYNARDRDRALKAHFESHPRFDVSTRDFITTVLSDLQCFSDWRKLLAETGSELPRQPAPRRRGRPPAAVVAARDQLREARKGCLLYTVPGQRALFAALQLGLEDATSPTSLEDMLRKVDDLYAAGFFDRCVRSRDGREKANPVWKDVLISSSNTVLNARKNWATAARLISYAMGGPVTRDDVEQLLFKNLSLRLNVEVLDAAVAQ